MKSLSKSMKFAACKVNNPAGVPGGVICTITGKRLGKKRTV
jgi:hypothetical protein